MSVAREHDEIWIIAIGEVSEIRSALVSEILEDGWQWLTFPTVDAFLTAPPYPRAILMPIIDTITLASLEVIRGLSIQLGLPVVVLNLERHSTMVHAALEAGADDVISTSSPPEETLVRLRAIIRVAFSPDDIRRQTSAYRLDDVHRTVSIEGGSAINLTLFEYRALRTLLATPNRPVSREHLIAQIVPFTRSRGSGVLDGTIGQLRRKIGAWRIQTVHGVGYRLIDD